MNQQISAENICSNTYVFRQFYIMCNSASDITVFTDMYGDILIFPFLVAGIKVCLILRSAYTEALITTLSN